MRRLRIEHMMRTRILKASNLHRQGDVKDADLKLGVELELALEHWSSHWRGVMSLFRSFRRVLFGLIAQLGGLKMCMRKGKCRHPVPRN